MSKLKHILILVVLAIFTSGYDALGLTDVNPEKNAYVHNNLGLGYLETGAYSAAIQEFKIAISLNPNTQASSVYYNNLGETYLKLGFYVQSQDCFERALKLHPLHFRYYLNLVTSYQVQGKLDSELRYWVRNKKTPLDDITIGLIYIAKGQKSRGIAILENFVMNEPKLYITDGVKYYMQGIIDNSR